MRIRVDRKFKIIINLMLIFCFEAPILISCQQNITLDKAHDLIVSEGFKNPMGFYDSVPTFSWKLPVVDGIISQSAYQIVVASSPELLPDHADLWNSDKQNTNQSVWIRYAGKPLFSRQKVYWQVKYWDQDSKSSSWSDVNHFELGLLNNSDWKGQWVGLDTAKDSIRGRENVLIHKPQYLRKVFDLADGAVKARLYITSKGVFYVSINGQNIGNDVMSPGFTSYDKRIETLTYDVTNTIKEGSNVIGVELASGWYSGRLLWGNTPWDNTVSPKILCQLELELSDGSTQVITSDNSWKGTTSGPLRFSEIYDGEVYNANLEIPNWNTSHFDDKNWEKVEVISIDENVKLQPKRHKTVKDKIKLIPQDIIIKDNAAIFDLQQNMVGVPLLKVPMKKGDTLKIRFAEMLQPNGTFYTKNYRSAHSTDYYIAAQDGQIEYKPKFTFHGFSYVELSGYDTTKIPQKNWLTGIVQYSDFNENGRFSSSSEKLNQLQSNIVWGLRGNFLDIPTDCPQRNERLGWTGDAQVFAPTSMYNADLHAFWASWMQSVRESQLEDGAIPWTVPDARGNNIASSGWGDACVIIPWEIYRQTGDFGILEDNFEMMKKWLLYHEQMSQNYISSMMSFADWLQPYPESGNNRGDTSKELIGTAFFANSAKLTSQIAGILGKTSEQERYESLYHSISKAFENKFFEEDGKVKGVVETQTSYLLALAFDLLSDDKKSKAQTHLISKIQQSGDHLRTGFLGTPLLSKVLDDMGQVELMYKLLFKESYPSWFYSINQGATTVWERWNSYSKTEGFNSQNMNSLNHYSYGAIGQWFYERIAGISPIEAGYKSFRIAPIPKEPLTSASASLETPYGKIMSSWEIDKGAFYLNVKIPPNTTAEIEILNSRLGSLNLNDQPITENSDSLTIEKTDRGYKILALPGSYRFQARYNVNE